MTVFPGWTVVAGAFLVLFTAYGAQYCFGVFFSALLEEFHWSRASLAGVFSLYVFGYCVSGFAAGRVTDRLGPRRVIAAGGVLLGGAMAAMALVRALWQPYLFYGVVAAMGMGTAYVPCNSTVVKWFAARRGLAMGLANTGASAGTLVLPPVAQLAVSGLGWRGAYVVFGLVVFVVLNAVAPWMRRDPAALGLHPDGAAAPNASATGGGFSLGAAVRTSAFWLLGAVYTATWLPVFIPLVHLVPFARDLGHSPLAAASAISALGAGALAGRLVMGWISDRIGRRATLATSLLMQAAAFLAFTAAHDLPGLYATAFLFGYSYGAITTLLPAIVGDFFGHEHAGTLVGFLFMLAGATSAWGPLAAGAVYDATGTYRPAWLLSALCNVVAFALLLACRPPVRRT
ncbi:MAG TPA: MFS transporter [Methylomirabilota bacterium]|nr:MFS transporter [Methylomirabilota bacterium]